MQVSQIISDARTELLEPIAGFWEDSELLRQASRAERDFVNRTRLCERDVFMSLEQGRRDYPLPADWLSTQAVFWKDPISSKWRRVFPTNLEKQAQENGNFLSDVTTDQENPRRYWIWNRRIFFTPTPKANGSSDIYMFYDAKPVELTVTTQSINIDDSLSEALTAFILWKAWSKEKEINLAQEQKNLYLGYIAEGRRWKKKRSGDQKFRIDLESQHQFTSGAGLSGFNPLAD